MGAIMPELRPARPSPGPKREWYSATANISIGGMPPCCDPNSKKNAVFGQRAEASHTCGMGTDQIPRVLTSDSSWSVGRVSDMRAAFCVQTDPLGSAGFGCCPYSMLS